MSIGEVPAQLCDTCPPRLAVRWVDGDRRLDTCARCGGHLREVARVRRVSESGFSTKTAAEAAMHSALFKIGQGTFSPPSDSTFGDWLAEWLTIQETRLRPSTLRSYRSKVTQHLSPALGLVELRRVTPDQLDVLYAEMLAKGSSRRTVQFTHTVARKALKDAVRKRRLVVNPADGAEVPKFDPTAEHQDKEMAVWTGPQLRAFLDFAKEDRLSSAFTLAATTGLRRGEIAGLKWSDVDLEKGSPVLRVRRARVPVGHDVVVSPPKTKYGHRDVPLTPEAVGALKTWRKVQVAERLALGAPADEAWIFTNAQGEPVHPDTISGAFEDQRDAYLSQEKVVAPRARLHDLRHTAATLWLQAGVAPHVVSRLLGHASVSFTLSTYAHALPDQTQDAAAKMSALLGGQA